MPSQYLQDMKPKEVPRGSFHVARWHGNGKLWISPIYKFSDKQSALAEVAIQNASPDPAGVRTTTPYFVWDAESWEAEEVRSNGSEPS